MDPAYHLHSTFQRCGSFEFAEMLYTMTSAAPHWSTLRSSLIKFESTVLQSLSVMLSLLLLCVLTRWADAALHHFFVGTVNGGSVYMLELDDVARTLTPLKNMTAAGASPSIAFDVSHVWYHERSSSELIRL
jgi:hypothetical protein